jgi:hypothetical protein
MMTPGWYPSPHYPGMMQYWSGTEWTPRISSPDSIPTTQAERADQAASATMAGASQIPATIGLIIGGIWTGVGLIALLITSMLSVPSIIGFAEYRGAPTVIGTVTGLQAWESSFKKKRMTPSQSPSCAPEAEFTVDGVEYVVQGRSFTSPCPWQVGQPISVTYRPDDIARSAAFTAEKEFSGWMLMPIAPIILMLPGVWMFIASLRLLRGQRRQMLHTANAPNVGASQ